MRTDRGGWELRCSRTCKEGVVVACSSPHRRGHCSKRVCCTACPFNASWSKGIRSRICTGHSGKRVCGGRTYSSTSRTCKRVGGAPCSTSTCVLGGKERVEASADRPPPHTPARWWRRKRIAAAWLRPRRIGASRAADAAVALLPLMCTSSRNPTTVFVQAAELSVRRPPAIAASSSAGVPGTIPPGAQRFFRQALPSL